MQERKGGACEEKNNPRAFQIFDEGLIEVTSQEKLFASCLEGYEQKRDKTTINNEGPIGVALVIAPIFGPNRETYGRCNRHHPNEHPSRIPEITPSKFGRIGQELSKRSVVPKFLHEPYTEKYRQKCH